jgi:small subunit ribosomal protein S3
MSVIKRIIEDSKEKLKVDELLSEEFESAGYGGITMTKTPLGTQINLFTMRPGRVIGKRGRSIKLASSRLEEEIGLENPQITVVEVEIPELNPKIMAARIANALERGVHYRRAIFWSLRKIMDSGAMGCEILVKGPLRSSRGRFEKVSEGYLPKSGDPAINFLLKDTIHVKMKRGTVGVNVAIVPPEAIFPDKVDLTKLPEIKYTTGEIKKYKEQFLEEDALPELEEDALPELEEDALPELEEDALQGSEIREIEDAEPLEIEERITTADPKLDLQLEEDSTEVLVEKSEDAIDASKVEVTLKKEDSVKEETTPQKASDSKEVLELENSEEEKKQETNAQDKDEVVSQESDAKEAS